MTRPVLFFNIFIFSKHVVDLILELKNLGSGSNSASSWNNIDYEFGKLFWVQLEGGNAYRAGMSVSLLNIKADSLSFPQESIYEFNKVP